MLVGIILSIRFYQKVGADIRAAAAQERMASSLEAISVSSTYRLFDTYPVVKRRHLTKLEDAKIMSIPGCAESAYMGYDNNIHPDYCR